MYKIRADRPLSQVTLVVLKALHLIAEKHNASYFIIGATARDILMTHAAGLERSRFARQ